MMNSSSKKNNLYKLPLHIIIAVFCIACILPVWLVISISFSHDADIFETGYSLLPVRFTTQAYQFLLQDPGQILSSYGVTTIVTICGTLLGLWLTATLAYAISRKSYRYRSITSLFVFFTMLFNGGMVPSYILISNWLHMKNTIFALIVPYLVSAWFVLIMKGFFQSIPEAMIESAKIDGAGELRIFLKIVIPVSKAGLAVVALFIVLQYWNDWWLSLLYIDDYNMMSLQYLMYRIMKNIEFLNSEFARRNMGVARMEIPTLSARMAMCILAAGPVLMVFPFFQKYFVKGITIGSVKG